MKSLYEKRIKKLEDTNLALINMQKKLGYRIFWLSFIFGMIIIFLLLEEVM